MPEHLSVPLVWQMQFEVDASWSLGGYGTKLCCQTSKDILFFFASLLQCQKNKCISAVLERTEHLSATCSPPAPVLSVLIAFKTPFKTWKKPLREEGLFTVEEDKDVTRSAVQLVKFLINHRGFQNKADCSGNLCKSWQFFLWTLTELFVLLSIIVSILTCVWPVL